MDETAERGETTKPVMPDEIRICMQALSQMNDGRRVVLYLDVTMQHGENWLPTMNVEGDDGFYRFPDMARGAVARFFGMDYAAAKQAVDSVNKALGIEPAEALDIVAAIIFRRDAR